MAINLKNYTTEVPAQRSVELIEKLLVNFGATNTMKEYGPDQSISALSFIIDIDGMKLPFRLPVKTDPIFKWLRNKQPKAKSEKLKEQSARVAWKHQYDWVFIQLTSIEMEQAEKLELLFPFLYDVEKRQTYFDKIKSGGYKALIGN